MGRKGKWNNCRYMEFLKQDIAIFYRICYIEIGDCMKLDIENLKLLMERVQKIQNKEHFSVTTESLINLMSLILIGRK